MSLLCREGAQGWSYPFRPFGFHRHREQDSASGPCPCTAFHVQAFTHLSACSVNSQCTSNVRSLWCHSGGRRPPIRQRSRCFLHRKPGWREQGVTCELLNITLSIGRSSTSTEWLINSTENYTSPLPSSALVAYYRCSAWWPWIPHCQGK